jgi:hypothetical protein
MTMTKRGGALASRQIRIDDGPRSAANGREHVALGVASTINSVAPSSRIETDNDKGDELCSFVSALLQP